MMNFAVFSDPMVGCLAALGERTGVPSFYISFVLVRLTTLIYQSRGMYINLNGCGCGHRLRWR